MAPTEKSIESLQHWLLKEGRVMSSMEELFENLATQLLQKGVPLDRVCGATTMLHPQTAAFDWTWESSNKHQVETVQYSYQEFQEYFDNADLALMRLYNGEPFLRFHKSRLKEIAEDYRDLFEHQGYVDGYGLQCTPGLQNWRAAVTWETKRPEGFAKSDIDIFNGIIQPLSAVMEIQTIHLSTGVLLRAYLGRDAGDRVHQGAVKRGDGTTIRAVVWFSDVRGFTKLSNELSRDELLELLNFVFEVTIEIVEAHGGEVLKLMGDGLMAVFPSPTGGDDDDGKSTCQAARTAAETLQKRLKQAVSECSERDLRNVEVGVGLHYGDVNYGNIGAPHRMDFTVIGRAVNLGSRVEGLCGKLGASVLATQDFVQREGGIYISRGFHTVKGVEHAIEVFEPTL